MVLKDKFAVEVQPTSGLEEVVSTSPAGKPSANGEPCHNGASVEPRRPSRSWRGLFLVTECVCLVLAVAPISVAVERTNNTDACLAFVLLLSGWALIRATEKGSLWLLLLSMLLVGIGFNTKMLAAFVVLPTYYLVYLLGAPVSWRSR